MWKRVELHNHTIESDGVMSVEELVSYLHSCNIQSFSLTDHNTISGWNDLEETCKKYNMEYMKGFELTSFYGHMLAQNINSYLHWEDINEDNADIFFQRAHELGGLAGPAHPFTIPTPFSNGMNWTMKIHDYTLVDFIEIINNAHPMFPDNQRGIEWWESLVLQGYKIAPVSGMDLHRKEDMTGFYTTYIRIKNHTTDTLSQQFDRAIKRCETQITKGPLLHWSKQQNKLDICPEYIDETKNIYIEVHTKNNKYVKEFMSGILSFPLEKGPCTVMVFEDVCDYEHLLCVAGPIEIE